MKAFMEKYVYPFEQVSEVHYTVSAQKALLTLKALETSHMNHTFKISNRDHLSEKDSSLVN